LHGERCGDRVALAKRERRDRMRERLIRVTLPGPPTELIAVVGHLEAGVGQGKGVGEEVVFRGVGGASVRRGYQQVTVEGEVHAGQRRHRVERERDGPGLPVRVVSSRQYGAECLMWMGPLWGSASRRSMGVRSHRDR
jgi:hypothetical protein